MNKQEFDYVIIGAGIAGCSLAHFLSKYSKSVLLIDKNEDVAFGASGAAGAFLSPLLGKPNKFKDLITKALNFSIAYYKENFPSEIINCGTCRIPKNAEDEEKFQSYIPYMDFDYEKFEDGYLFKIGSVVKSYEICKKLSSNTEKLFNYEINKIEKVDDIWVLNSEIKAKNLFLTTGADILLIKEKYMDIRAVWGQKIDISTTTSVDINYHKECSLSVSSKDGTVSIGATHNRFDDEKIESSYDLRLKNINKLEHNEYTNKIIQNDISILLNKANDIKTLNDVKVLDVKIGARASSVDYFPMVGKLVDSQKSFEKYPHLKNGFQIKNENLEMINNLYILNGVGGRGFVLSPYLAYVLVENIFNNQELEEEITNYRLFKRWAKKQKN
ncbi:MAG: FAD-dependent oxidoreductase [Aliarcobacter sp.]|nr:FAD-dependent oxidoreductase [Aliarcobacter sp.]